MDTNSKNKNIIGLHRGISDFTNGSLLRTNIVMDGKGDLVTDCHRILASWRNHFSQQFNAPRG